MPHTFPRRRFRPAEVADPEPLNEVFQDAAAKLAGRLGEQDVSNDVKGKLTIADEAYYDAHLRVKDVSPDLTDNTTLNYPWASVSGDGAYDLPAVVEDSTAWQSIQDSGGTDTMALTFTCGDGDQLVMFGHLQHFAWLGAGTTSSAASIAAPLKLQYAFELDGTILEHSITGAAVWPDPPPQAWYRATPASAVIANEYDYRHVQYVQNTLGISHAAGAHRMMLVAPVSAGDHTVEIKARRLPMSDMKVDSAGDGTKVEVFNRRLFVLRIKGDSPRSGTGSSLVVDVFEDGQVLEAADVNADSFGRIQTELNDLDEANLSRGLFRNEHLGSVVYGPACTGIEPAAGADTVTGLYPGYNTNGAGWEVIDNGAGTNLEVTGPTAGEWRLDTFPGLFVVLANVQVNHVIWTGASAPSNDVRALGILALRVVNSAGTATLIGETEVYVNGHAFDNEAVEDSADLEIDVPLMWVVDSASLSAANQRIVRVEVVGCVWDGAAATSPPEVEMLTQRGMICAFALKGVHA